MQVGVSVNVYLPSPGASPETPSRPPLSPTGAGKPARAKCFLPFVPDNRLDSLCGHRQPCSHSRLVPRTPSVWKVDPPIYVRKWLKNELQVARTRSRYL